MKMLLIDVRQPVIRRVCHLPRGSAPFAEESRGLPVRRWTLRGYRAGRFDFKRNRILANMDANKMIAGAEPQRANRCGFGDSNHVFK